MRQLVLTAFVVLIGTTTFAQTAPTPIAKDSVIQEQRFYFPATNYNDSGALSKAIPKLAEQVLKVYHNDNKSKYYDNVIPYYFLTENYGKVSDMVDSVQKIDSDKSYDIEVKSYARAKLAEIKQPGSLEKVFKKEFSEAFDPLSFRKKVNFALADSSVLDYYLTDYTSVKENLQKNKKDTLTLEDARSLCDKFYTYTFYSKVYPLMASSIDKQYKKTYPAIQGPNWSGVVPVESIDEKPDPNIQYKLLFEFTGFAYKGQESTAKKDVNPALTEVARLINLHEANGIPRKNIQVAIVAHGPALRVFLTNEKYKKKYGVDNPNISLIKQLQDYGVKMLVCGQAMTFLNLEMEDLVPGMKQVLTAQTVISSYQLKGYVYYDESLRDE